MVFRWLRRSRRPESAAPLPSEWRAVLDSIPWTSGLTPDEASRFEGVLRRFVAEKRWEGCAGLVLTDEMKVVVAAHAALLALNLPDDVYRRVRTILFYPSTFVNPEARPDSTGIFHEGTPLAGEAWHGQGPVIVSWDSARRGVAQPDDGSNVLLHELAHKLDLLDGWADGTPPLARRADLEAWNAAMKRELAALRLAVDRGRRTVLDAYGATDPSEFFAVATETFFERPRALREQTPRLYERLASYYGQDPAARNGTGP
jgi:MtfA peptidase